jgi:hypothetical protein
MKPRLIIRIIYLTILLLLTIYIWQLLYSAQFLPYDENYGVLIYVFIISVLVTVILTILWFKARSFIKQNSIETILFLLVNSPLTIALVFYFYIEIFGQLKF